MAREHFDVLVIGAGLSGIGAGYRLQTECPDKSYAILEGRGSLGGTWDLFRYPGIRSDSDMFTLGYPFRPWSGAKSIADGPSILSYLRETAEVYGIERHIRFNQRVISAAWDSETATWTVEAQASGADDGVPVEVSYTCNFLYTCCGYYSYKGGFTPGFEGIDDFTGQILHPQEWPEDLDCSDKRIIVIGSGATAVTLVPAIAQDAAHVIMLQRSPTYITALPSKDVLADKIRGLLPENLAHRIIRWKNVLLTLFFFQLSRRAPKTMRKMITDAAAKALPPNIDVDPHFVPTYNPWDQRMCLVPDGDFFKALRSGKADVVTDRIAKFTSTGILLESGAELDADIVVTATGLTLVAVGEMRITVDGERVESSDTYTYRGYMLSGIPNFALCVGYTNASWTLRADLTSRSVCKLLRHMDAHGYVKAVPTVDESSIEARPLLGLNSGYIQRATGVLPRQGSRDPWNLRQNYVLDAFTTRFGDVNEDMVFTRGPRPGHDARAAERRMESKNAEPVIASV
jgi:cation diffusion facilitator CzcD-associated flavoprotein CzcO